MGAVFSYIAQGGFVGAGFAGGSALLTVVAVYLVLTGLAFVLLSRLFGKRRGHWIVALTPLALVPVVIVTTISPTGDYAIGNAAAYAAGGAVAAVMAFLTHPGPLRLFSALGITAAIAIVAATISTNVMKDAEAEAQDHFGSDIRPYVSTIDGYAPRREPTARTPDLVVGGFGVIEPGQIQPQGDAADFVIATERIVPSAERLSACGPELFITTDFEGTEAVDTCDKRGELWMRTSASGHEVAWLVDDLLVRVSAQASTPRRLLQEILASTRPMADEYYKHLLFGEEGHYFLEYDGYR